MSWMHQNTMAFGQGTVVTEGYYSCPAMPGGTTVTTGLTANEEVFFLNLNRKVVHT